MYRLTTWVPKGIAGLIPQAKPRELGELFPEAQIVDLLVSYYLPEELRSSRYVQAPRANMV
jgi:hypothetical protein